MPKAVDPLLFPGNGIGVEVQRMCASPHYGQLFRKQLSALCRLTKAFRSEESLQPGQWQKSYTTGLREQIARAADSFTELDRLLDDIHRACPWLGLTNRRTCTIFDGDVRSLVPSRVKPTRKEQK